MLRKTLIARNNSFDIVSKLHTIQLMQQIIFSSFFYTYFFFQKQLKGRFL